MSARMSGITRLVVLLVALSLGLSVLMLGTVDRADAQISCADGVQSGVRCEIEGPAPTNGADGLECSQGFELAGNRCVRYELASGVNLTCPTGVLVVDECIEDLGPPPAGQSVCPVSATVLESGAECYMLVNKIGGDTCPAGSTPAPDGTSCRRPVAFVDQTINEEPVCPDSYAISAAAGGLCARLVPALQPSAACPQGARGDAGSCYFVVGVEAQCPDFAMAAGDTCIVEGPLPVSGSPSCPVSATVMEDGNDCFTLVNPGVSTACPVPTVPDPASGLCRQSVAKIPGPFVCVAGFVIIAGTCIRYAAPDGADCPAGSLTDSFGVCRQPVADRATELFCADAAAQLVGSDCVITTYPQTCTYNEAITGCNQNEPRCPDGFVSDGALNGLCASYDPALQLPDGCPDGARGTAGACYILVAKGPRGQGVCSFGTLAGSNCVITGPSPTPGPGSCPVSAAVQLDGDDCYTLVATDPSFGCPGTSTPDPVDSSLCRLTVAPVPGPLQCVLGFGLLNGECVRYEAPVFPSPECPFGSTEDAAGDCRKPVADAQGAYYCESPDAALNGLTCVFTTGFLLPCQPGDACDDGSGCPAGFAFDLGLEVCTSTVPAEMSSPGCPTGTLGTPGACYVLEPAVPTNPTCAAGELVGSTCVITGNPPEEGSCDLGFGFINNECVRYEAPAFTSQECPAGAFLDADGLCRKPVTGVLGPAYCEDPNAVLQGADCLVTAPFSLTCSTAQALAGECGQATITCPVGFSIDDSLGGLCARFEPASQGSTQPTSACPAEAQGDPGACYILVAKLPAGPGICQTGVLTGSSCVITGAPPIGSQCEVGFALIEGECLAFATPAFPAPQCPLGSFEDVNGDCLEPVADIPIDPVDPGDGGGATVCPDGALGEPGACYILVAKGPAGEGVCEVGDLIFSNCVELGAEPTQDPSVCPVSATVSEDGDECYRLELGDPSLGCFEGLPDPNDPYLCRVPVTKIPGALRCAATFELRNGECVRYSAPVFPSPQCPLGSFEDADGNCRKPVADAMAPYFCVDPLAALNGKSCVFVTAPIATCDPASGACGGERTVQVCPVSGTVIEDGPSCFTLLPFDAAVCAAGQVMDPSLMTSCRKPVERVVSAGACPTGSALIEGTCLVFSEPIGLPDLDCFGADAAACDNLVETAQPEIPIDELVSQRPTAIDYFGCAGGTARFQVTDASTAVVASGALTETSTGVYEGSYEVPSSGAFMLEVTIDCPDGTINEASQNLVFIDPSGFVTDCAGDIVVGAEVTLWRSDSATGTLTVVADGDATIMDPSVNVRNPSLTESNGRYRWDVVAGFYQVTVSVPGQPVVSSEVLQVPPARTDVDLELGELNCVIPVEPEPPSNQTPVSYGPIRGGAEFVAEQQANAVGTAAQPVAAAVPVAVDTPAQPPLAITGVESVPRSLAALASIGIGFSLLGASRSRTQRRDSAGA